MIVFCSDTKDLTFENSQKQTLKLDVDAFYVRNRNGEMEIKPAFKEMFANLSEEDLFEVIETRSFKPFTYSNRETVIKKMERLQYRITKPVQQAMHSDFPKDNFGLAINKFAPFENDRFQLLRNDRRKLYHECPKYDKLLTELATCQNAAAAQLRRQGYIVNTISAKTNSRLAIGLGSESVYETAMTLHPIFGFPYIPGQSIKGIVRSCIINTLFGGEESVALTRSKAFCYLFGKSTEGFNDQSACANVVFNDAYPIEELKVIPDVMNPHYSDYYQGEAWPADYLNPVPIFFLTVAKNCTFKFEIIINAQKNSFPDWITDDIAEFQNKAPIDITKDWLITALAQQGIGAKTAIGYGRME